MLLCEVTHEWVNSSGCGRSHWNIIFSEYWCSEIWIYRYFYRKTITYIFFLSQRSIFTTPVNQTSAEPNLDMLNIWPELYYNAIFLILDIITPYNVCGQKGCIAWDRVHWCSLTSMYCHIHLNTLIYPQYFYCREKWKISFTNTSTVHGLSVWDSSILFRISNCLLIVAWPYCMHV